MIAVDNAWEARRNERGEVRSCNPETEFRKGFAAATRKEPWPVESPINWPGLYRVSAERAAQYEKALRLAGLSVRDALDMTLTDEELQAALTRKDGA